MTEYAFIDDGGIERLRGTIDPPPGGGSISFLSVPISSAELLALDATPKELLAAPSGRNYHVVFGVVLHYRFGTVAYTGDWLAGLGYGSTIEEITPVSEPGTGGLGYFGTYGPAPFGQGDGNAMLQQEEDAYQYCVAPWVNLAVSEMWNTWLASGIEGKALSLGNFPPSDPLAEGDGTMTVRIWYATIDGAP